MAQQGPTILTPQESSPEPDPLSMSSIYPIPSTRTSDLMVSQRVYSQLQATQLDLLRAQSQISTGKKYTLASDDPASAVRAIALRRTIERKAQIKTNLQVAKSYLTSSDTNLASAAGLLSDIRGSTLTVVGNTVSDTQRSAVAEEVRRAIDQFLGIGNTQFRDRYLFGGSASSAPPFETSGAYIRYNGNEIDLNTYSDVGQLLATNASGVEVFGAVSPQQRGTVDLQPALIETTKIADLYGGAGVRLGTIILSDGASTSTVDLSSAESIGDVIGLIERTPPPGREVIASIADNVLRVELVGATTESFTIRDAGGATTAAELGILETVGAPGGVVTGIDLNPRLTPTTQLADLFVTSSGSGPPLDLTSGLQIVNNGQTHTITFEDATTVEDILNRLNGSPAGVFAAINSAGNGIDIRSRLSGVDFQIGENGGTTGTQLGLRSLDSGTPLADLNHGVGVEQSAGAELIIQRSDGTQLEIDLAGAYTVGDVLDRINTHPDNLDPATRVEAHFRAVGNGIELVDANAAGTTPLTVIRPSANHAAWDLGLVPRGSDQNASADAGPPWTIAGSDVNPLESKGVFNTLLRLQQALEANDQEGIARAIGNLDADLERVTFARAEIGARTRNIELMQQRWEDENVELQSNLSLEVDVDQVEAVLNLTSRQFAFEAALRASAQLFQMSLLNFL